MTRARQQGGGWRLEVRTAGIALLGLALLPVFPSSHLPVLAAQNLERGKALYDQWCAGCHGDTGAGDGAAASWMLPRPRDFTTGLYQVRTTASGELPTDADIRRVIDDGMPGTTMPGWRNKFGSADRDALVAYIKTFSRFFEGASPQPIAISKPPRVTAEGLAEGRRLFEDEVQCLRCHGDQGRGDGTSAPELTDDAGFPIRAADLTENWTFNGGGRVEDIFMRMRTGLDGTPMPSNSDAIDAGIITEEQLWRVAQYVRSLSPETMPRRRDVVRAAFAESGLPAGPTDEAWDGYQSFYIPMVAQITLKPRWFVPAVDGLYVRAAHDGERLVLLVTWSDVSRSPDPAWQPYFDGIVRSLEAPDGPHLTQQAPDRLTLQFPLTPPEGMEMPYFLGGDARRPVYVLRWTSSPDAVEEGQARGLGTFVARGGSDVTHQAAFANGEWRVQFSRSLVATDSTVAPHVSTGRPIPIAFSVSDGSGAEDEMRSAISSWYAIYLDTPLPPRVFVAPVIAVLLTAGMGTLVVLQAQRRERQQHST